MSTAIYIILALVLVYFFYSGFRKYQMVKNYDPESESKSIVVLTDKNFKSSVSKGVTLVDFWAPWCGPCKMIAPVISELAEEFEGKAKVSKLNVDHNKVTASKYGIRSIPTLIIFKDGEPVKKFMGIKSKNTLSNAIKEHL